MMEPQQIEEKERILCRSLKQSYEDGIKGAAGYPIDSAEIIAEYTKRNGDCSAFMQGFLTLFVGSLNAEYSRGRKEGST